MVQLFSIADRKHFVPGVMKMTLDGTGIKTYFQSIVTSEVICHNTITISIIGVVACGHPAIISLH